MKSYRIVHDPNGTQYDIHGKPIRFVEVGKKDNFYQLKNEKHNKKLQSRKINRNKNKIASKNKKRNR